MCHSSLVFASGISRLSYGNIPKRFLHSGQNILTSKAPVLLFFTGRILRCSENPLHPLQKPVYSGSKSLHRPSIRSFAHSMAFLQDSQIPDVSPVMIASYNSWLNSGYSHFPQTRHRVAGIVIWRFILIVSIPGISALSVILSYQPFLLLPLSACAI